MKHREYTVFYPAENLWAFAVFDTVEEALEYVDKDQLTIIYRDGKVFMSRWPIVRRKEGITIEAAFASFSA